MNAIDVAESHFRKRDHRKVEVVNVSREHDYLDLAFDHDPGIFKHSADELLTGHNVIMHGVQPDTGEGDARVWFTRIDMSVERTTNIEIVEE